MENSPSQVEAPLLIHTIDDWTVVEFRTVSLMDTLELGRITSVLYPLIDEQDKKLVVLDFSSVKYLSSQAIGIVVYVHRKLAAIPRSRLVLCGVNPTLMQLLKITQLDRILTIKSTQREATKVSTAL